MVFIVHLIMGKGRLNSSRLKSRCEVIGKRKKKAHLTTVETTPVDVNSPCMNVGNQNQFNTTMSSYNPTQPVRLPSYAIIWCVLSDHNLSTIQKRDLYILILTNTGLTYGWSGFYVTIELSIHKCS